MKRIETVVLAGVIYILTLTAVLAEPPADAKPCEIYSWTAGQVMMSRQAGTMITDQMKLLDTHLPPGSQGRETVRLMILEAYETPLYHTESFKEQTIREYKNKWYLQCERAGWQNLK